MTSTLCAATFSNSYVMWHLRYVVLRFVAVPINQLHAGLCLSTNLCVRLMMTSGRIIKETLCNKRILTCDISGYVLRSSFCPYYVCLYVVMANRWDEDFFWPIAVSHLRLCDTQRRMKLERDVADYKDRLSSKDLRLKTSTKKDLFNSHQGMPALVATFSV